MKRYKFVFLMGFFFVAVGGVFAATYPAQAINLREECLRRDISRENFGSVFNFYPGPTEYCIVVDGGIWPLNGNVSVGTHLTLDMQAGAYFQSTNGSTLVINGGLLDSGQSMFDCEVTGLAVAHPGMFLSNSVARAKAAVVGDESRATKLAGVTLGATTLTSWETGLSSYATTGVVEDLNHNFGISQGNFSNLETYVNGTLVPQVNENFDVTEHNFTRGNALMGSISNNFYDVYSNTYAAFVSAAGGMTNTLPSLPSLEGFSWDWWPNRFRTNYTDVSNMPPMDLSYAYISNLFVTVDSYAGSTRYMTFALSNFVDDINAAFLSVSNSFTNLAYYLTNAVDGVVPVFNENDQISMTNFIVLNGNMQLFSNAIFQGFSTLYDQVYTSITSTYSGYAIDVPRSNVVLTIPYTLMETNGYGVVPTDIHLDLSGLGVLIATNYTAMHSDFNALSVTVTDNDSAIWSAHDALNTNFTNLQFGYNATTSTVNHNAGLQITNALIANTNQWLLSNTLSAVFGYVSGTFNTIAGVNVTNKMGFDYDWSYEGVDAETIDFDLNLTPVDLAGALLSLTEAQITSNAPGVVVNSISISNIAAATTYIDKQFSSTTSSSDRTLYSQTAKWYYHDVEVGDPGYYNVSGWWANVIGGNPWFDNPVNITTRSFSPIIQLAGIPYVAMDDFTLATTSVTNAGGGPVVTVVTDIYFGPEPSGYGQFSFAAYTADGYFRFSISSSSNTAVHTSSTFGLQVVADQLVLSED